jgi:hypothetical protein
MVPIDNDCPEIIQVFYRDEAVSYFFLYLGCFIFSMDFLTKNQNDFEFLSKSIKLTLDYKVATASS